MLDPFAVCAPHVRLVHDFHAGPDFTLLPRRICDHALLFVQRGSGRLFADGHEWPLTPGSLIIVPPETEHAFQLADPSGVNMLNIHYDPVMRSDSAQIVQWVLDPGRPRKAMEPTPLVPGQGAMVLPMHPSASYVAAFRRLGRSWPDAQGAELLSQRAAMLDLLAVVLRTSGAAGQRPTPSPQLERARRYLEEASGTVRLEEAARRACLGRSAFAEAFQRHFGLAPMAYRRRSRIERAKADLLWGGMSVKAVARQAGFANVQHFTRVFARLVGEPPAAYGRRARP
jgi:AraC-like DNA-binding protein